VSIYQANGPVPLTQLKEMSYGSLFFVDELQKTIDFAGPIYRKVYEVIMQMLTATENLTIFFGRCTEHQNLSQANELSRMIY
jgi:hypothetical protein